MKWLYGAVVLSMMAIGIFSIMRFGYEPAPVGVMKPTMFSHPEELGAVTYRRFYSPIESKKLVVVGVPPQPEWHREIVKGMIKAAIAEKTPFNSIIIEEQMPPFDVSEFANLQVHKLPTNSKTQAELIDKISELKKNGERILVYMPSVYSTHAIEGNAVSRYEKTTGETLFSITTGPLSLGPDQEHLVDPPCVGSARDERGTAKLGCMILQSSRMQYRKNLKAEKWIGFMTSPKPEDFLLMVAAPGQVGGPPTVVPTKLRTGESNR